MIQEVKDLLLKDLCARLPYGVKLQDNLGDILPLDYHGKNLTVKSFTQILSNAIEEYGIRPYLRPMSSMTKEELEEYNAFFSYDGIDEFCVNDYYDWLNEHHFDYRGLIKRGLALPAGEGMYDN